MKQMLSDFMHLVIPSEKDYNWKEILAFYFAILGLVVLLAWIRAFP